MTDLVNEIIETVKIGHTIPTFIPICTSKKGENRQSDENK